MNPKQTTAATLAAALLSISPAQAGDFAGDRIEQNRRLIERYFEEVWNQGKLDVLDELMHPAYVNHSPGLPDPLPGPAGLKPIVAAMRIGLPDMHYTIEDMVIAPDKVAVRVTLRATHTGDLFGMAPTGKRIEVDQMQIEHIEGGKIVEHWRRTDDMGLLRQLGQIK
ncbi:MAG: ester cyclase [Ferrovibrio sp.]|uniref:ester cyclase n=1 Tax=Ferrovibrio sp. TaxID=1917215 RepID=UPI00391BF3B0